MKRYGIIILVLAVAAVVLTTACGHLSAAENSAAEMPDADTSAADTAAAELSPEDDPVTGALTMPDYTEEIRGRVARFTDGSVMLFTESSGPILLSGEMNFDGLKNGDDLTIFCNGVEETYPGRADVVEMTFHGKGTPSELARDVLENLEGLGYELADDENAK